MPEDNPQTPQVLPTLSVNSIGAVLLIPVLPILPVIGIPLALHALAGAAIGSLAFTAASMLLGPSRGKLLNITELFQGKSSGKFTQVIESVATPELLQEKSSAAPEVLA
jgi:hypothetical protein